MAMADWIPISRVEKALRSNRQIYGVARSQLLREGAGQRMLDRVREPLHEAHTSAALQGLDCAARAAPPSRRRTWRRPLPPSDLAGPPSLFRSASAPSSSRSLASPWAAAAQRPGTCPELSSGSGGALPACAYIAIDGGVILKPEYQSAGRAASASWSLGRPSSTASDPRMGSVGATKRFNSRVPL